MNRITLTMLLLALACGLPVQPARADDTAPPAGPAAAETDAADATPAPPPPPPPAPPAPPPPPAVEPETPAVTAPPTPPAPAPREYSYLVMAFAWPGEMWADVWYLPDEDWEAEGKAKVICDIQEMLTNLSPPQRPRRLIAFSYTIAPLDRGKTATTALRRMFDVSETLGIPMYVEMATYTWWQSRKDLWSDPQNVEWTGWSPETAMTEAVRNWGFPFEVAPHPFLGSRAYRKAVEEAIRPMGEEIAKWCAHLQRTGKPQLFAGMDMDDEINPLNFGLSDEAIKAREYGILTHSYLARHGGDPLGILPPKPEGVSEQEWIGQHADWRPDDFDEDGVEAIREYLTWQAGIWKETGVPENKMYIHSVPDFATGLAMSKAAFVPGARPAWSVYPGWEDVDDMIAQFSSGLKARGWPPWGVSEFIMGGSEDDIAGAIEKMLSALPNNRIFLVQNWDNLVRAWLTSEDEAKVRQGEAFLAAVRKTLL